MTIIWDLETKKPRDDDPDATDMGQMAIMRSGKTRNSSSPLTDKTLFGPVDFGTIKGWKVADGKEMATFLTADDEKGRANQNVTSIGPVARRQAAHGNIAPSCPIPAFQVDEENSLVVWDIASGKRLDRTTLPALAAIAPNGSYLTYSKDKNLVLYDLAEKQERGNGTQGHRIHGTRARNIDLFSHDSALLAFPLPFPAVLSRGQAAAGCGTAEMARAKRPRNGDRQTSHYLARAYRLGKPLCVHAG